MVDMRTIRSGLGKSNLFDVLQPVVVHHGAFVTSLVPTVQMWQLHPQDCSLYLIESAVPAEELTAIFLGTTMGSRHAKIRCLIRALGNDHATIAIRSKILAREEGKASEVAKRTHRVTGIFRS